MNKQVKYAELKRSDAGIFPGRVHNWYLQNQRQLPWRGVTDPYLIWISEIILQQTRVKQGLPYYERFVERFPNVEALALAEEDELMKMWEGLGYYSRARNLHAAAKSIMIDYGGLFPGSYINIRKLKGVGDYTAAAIASIAFGLPHAVVDGNVMRVFARYFGIESPVNTHATLKEMYALANTLLPEDNPGMHNQALMEFGALVCTPKRPACGKCPVNHTCLAYNSKIVDKLPVKNNPPDRITKYLVFVLVETETQIIIQKRNKDGIWKNLFQLPVIETKHTPADEEIISLEVVAEWLADGNSELVAFSEVYVHLLTHRRLISRFVQIKTNELSLIRPGFIAVSKKDLYKFAFPVLIRKYLARKELV
jgi:A/G-specific adenine glycosylase